MTEQLALFPEKSVPLANDPGRFYRRPHSQQLRRDSIWRHQHEGRAVYHPLKVRDELRRVLAAGGWVPFLDLCRLIDVGVYGLDYVIEHMERRGLLVARPRYYGSDPMVPNMPPAKYQGFQFEYRLNGGSAS